MLSFGGGVQSTSVAQIPNNINKMLKQYKKIARQEIDRTVSMDSIPESYDEGTNIYISTALQFKPSTIIVKAKMTGEALESYFYLNSDVHAPSKEMFVWANVHICIKDITKNGFNINFLKMTPYERWTIKFTEIIAIG